MTLNGVVDFAGAKKDTERYTIKLYRFNNSVFLHKDYISSTDIQSLSRIFLFFGFYLNKRLRKKATIPGSCIGDLWFTDLGKNHRNCWKGLFSTS